MTKTRDDESAKFLRLEHLESSISSLSPSKEILLEALKDDYDVIRAEVLDYFIANPSQAPSQSLLLASNFDESYIVRGRLRVLFAKLGSYKESDIAKFSGVLDEMDLVWHWNAMYIVSRQPKYLSLIAVMHNSADKGIQSLARHTILDLVT